MKTLKDEEVKKQSGEAWTYDMGVPDSIEEAMDIYGAEGAYDILMGGLKVRLQNIAREAFGNGKTREEVEALITAYKPGNARQSFRDISLDLIIEKRDLIKADDETEKKVRALNRGGKYKELVELLETL